MEPRVYEEIAGLEDWHWWFVNVRLALLDALTPLLAPAARILDAGCGSGAMLRELARRGRRDTVGTDISMRALAHAARSRAAPVLACDLTALPFADASFDAITCTDVLEHVEHDRAALAQCFRVLKPGGHLGLVVPAHQFLWTDHDVANHHFRRYTRAPLVELFRAAGFELVRATYLNGALGVPIAVHRLLRKMLEVVAPRRAGVEPESDIKPIPRPINALFDLVFRAERAVLPHVDLPFGTSVMVVARRPGAA